MKRVRHVLTVGCGPAYRWHPNDKRRDMHEMRRFFVFRPWDTGLNIDGTKRQESLCTSCMRCDEFGMFRMHLNLVKRETAGVGDGRRKSSQIFQSSDCLIRSIQERQRSAERLSGLTHNPGNQKGGPEKRKATHTPFEKVCNKHFCLPCRSMHRPRQRRKTAQDHTITQLQAPTSNTARKRRHNHRVSKHPSPARGSS